MDEDRKVEIAATMIQIVSVIIAGRETCRTDAPPTEVRATPYGDLAALSPEHSIVTDPLGYSLRLGLKHIGRILNAEGGFELMEEMAGIVDAFPRFTNTLRPAVIINSAWDGIGDWHA